MSEMRRLLNLMESQQDPSFERELSELRSTLEGMGFRKESDISYQGVPGERWVNPEDAVGFEFTNTDEDSGMVGWAGGSWNGQKLNASESGNDDISDMVYLVSNMMVEPDDDVADDDDTSW